ncbi:hypothetical protein SAMN02746065_11732 [Desulfocicer vacuolatum DSM 3385]|uniref:HEAT repeat-containing protein n=1 Tax=Desulfocicer vacuolatum DSM 3385 TaxID=1121400 RepID=A0A1W2DG22_9BACT|nr:DVU0298 family protein [Desulfocicer vacuolatum]SMC95916.1 hypothetical protein SAMN02746065_11732 [Desulfocicer vacuolatum DSM 3385]
MRQLKQKVYELLCMKDEAQSLEGILSLPPGKSVNALFTYIQHTTEAVKWRAITAMGRVVLQIYEDKPESARIIMRRLMWSLNDESGGIGWGAPEAMGEIMALNKKIAWEYRNLLLSYVDSEGNYLEYAPLRKGAVWAIKRVTEAHPDVMAGD